MKLSYDPETRTFVISELGHILDTDIDSDALVARYGFVAPPVSDETTDEEAQEIAEHSQNSWWATQRLSDATQV